MKQILLSLTLFLAFTTQGQSVNSAKKEKIKALFALMHQDSLMIKTIEAMSTSMVANITKIFSDTAYTNHGVDASQFTQELMVKSMQQSK